MRLDARIPLVFATLADAGPTDALLVEGQGARAPGRDHFTASENPHPFGCTCCVPRNPAALALARLLLARGRGQGPFFRRVIAVTATPAGRATVLAAVQSDPLAASCCVLGDQSA
jgi:hypothetical protein